MFEGFANVWTPVAPASDLRRRPLGIRLAGVPVVLFRDQRGRASALIDRCPHRGVALSMGEVTKDGCLECPFHGWSFRADGTCARVPLNGVPEDKRARHAATALPVREVGGFVWVFTGADAAGTEPEPAPALVEPGWYGTYYEETWNVHWTRAMENMLDMPHLPFIHRRTIGRGLRAKLRPDSVMEVSVEPTPWGARLLSSLDGATEDASLAWRRPNGMELQIVPNRSHGHVFCVPIDAEHTRMIFHFGYRGRALHTISRLFDRFNRRIAAEDRGVVESSQPKEVPPPGGEISVATDEPTLYFRRYYYRELRGSSARLVPASRLAGARRGDAALADVAAERDALVAE